MLGLIIEYNSTVIIMGNSFFAMLSYSINLYKITDMKTGCHSSPLNDGTRCRHLKHFEYSSSAAIRNSVQWIVTALIDQFPLRLRRFVRMKKRAIPRLDQTVRFLLGGESCSLVWTIYPSFESSQRIRTQPWVTSRCEWAAAGPLRPRRNMHDDQMKICRLYVQRLYYVCNGAEFNHLLRTEKQLTDFLVRNSTTCCNVPFIIFIPHTCITYNIHVFR